MAGSKLGGKKTAKTIKERYGEDYYRIQGAKGGKKGTTGGFAAGEEGRARARVAGRLGGQISRRGKKISDE